MPSSVDNLSGLALAAIEDANAALARTGDVAAWRAAMGRAITTAHTAALLTALAERGGTSAARGWLARAIGAAPEALLSPEERAALREAIEEQLRYLDRFTAEVRADKLSPAQIAARAALYGLAIRPFFYARRWGEWEIPPELLPGNQTCRGRCRCRLTGIVDNGDGTGVLTRVMGGEDHCDDCPPLAGDHPIRRRRA